MCGATRPTLTFLSLTDLQTAIGWFSNWCLMLTPTRKNPTYCREPQIQPNVHSNGNWFLWADLGSFTFCTLRAENSEKLYRRCDAAAAYFFFVWVQDMGSRTFSLVWNQILGWNNLRRMGTIENMSEKTSKFAVVKSAISAVSSWSVNVKPRIKINLLSHTA